MYILKKQKNKKGVEFNFAWIFAIIVGVVIILLAVYAAVKLVGIEKKSKDTEVGKEIAILLTPVETILESGKTTKISLSQETRIYNDCDLKGNFGNQGISVATSSGVGNKWEKPGVVSRFHNKYLFSSSIVQGKEFYVLSKPLSLPYKVADLVILWSDKEKYCFVNPTNDIEENLISLNVKNINISSNIAGCPEHYIKVCFTSSGCDIDVNLNANSLKKKGQKTQTFIKTDNNALIFAAIFSEPLIYECQLQRLRFRASELALLYASKSSFLEGKSCTSTNLQSSLISYSNMTRNQNISINTIYSLSEQIKQENKGLLCELF